jgi:heat-inducible transcriptional repressor
MSYETTERQRRILARLVTEYIEQGEPVSSAWLAEHSTLGVSSATVRNILARLEEQGLVHQPHTSAGRVPTDSGYRMYVDGLLETRKKPRVQAEIEARLRRAGTVSDLLENASQELSRASQHIGFALEPTGPSIRLRHIDFVNLEGGRVLVIVVSTSGHITHKVIEPPEPCDDVVLTQAANYLNEAFAGLTLHEIRTAIVDRLRQERNSLRRPGGACASAGQHRPGRARRRRIAVRPGRVAAGGSARGRTGRSRAHAAGPARAVPDDRGKTPPD